MFLASASRAFERVSYAIDDMLLGDYDYVLDGEWLYADVDYRRVIAETQTRSRRESQPTRAGRDGSRRRERAQLCRATAVRAAVS